MSSTLSLDRAPAPSRRSLFGAGAALLAGGAVLASASRKPLPGAPGPDAELLQLGSLLDEACARENQAFAIAERENTDELFDVADAIAKQAEEIAEKIQALSATTLAGLDVKRRALSWCHCGEPITADALSDHHQPGTDDRLLAGIINDLRTMAGALS